MAEDAAGAAEDGLVGWGGAKKMMASAAAITWEEWHRMEPSLL